MERSQGCEKERGDHVGGSSDSLHGRVETISGLRSFESVGNQQRLVVKEENSRFQTVKQWV